MKTHRSIAWQMSKKKEEEEQKVDDEAAIQFISSSFSDQNDR